MEKINTPLMALIEELKTEQLAYAKMNVDCKGIDIAIRKAESKIQTEREVIEKAWSDGIKFITTDGAPTENLKKDYFTKKFKSYE